MNLKRGMITTEGETATLTFERRLSQPVDTVWEAITEPRHREKWFGPTTIDPKAGGNIETLAAGPPAPEENRRSKGEIVVWEPPRIFEYKEEPAIAENRTFRFELTSVNEGTNLKFINSGMNSTDARGHAPGWHVFLELLASYLDGTILPEWDEIYRQVQPAYREE